MKFKELGLNTELLEALSYMGFEEATPVQEQAIPLILDKKDLIACAQTGTGKTAAFILPVLELLSRKTNNNIKALVICPTRELALQIEQQIQAFSYFVGISSVSIYGGGDGQDFERQRKSLTQGTDIIVATPGKLISHLNMGYVNFKELEYLILDEADRMLDMGFHEDIITITSHMPDDRQTLLFSATMPSKIRKLANTILKNPEQISLAISKPAAGVLQGVYLTYDSQKIPLIKRLIKDKPSYESIIIFSSTKKKVSQIVRSLSGDGYQISAVSSDYDQKEREMTMRKFRSKEVRVVVATDVLSRGIDIKGINLVINFDVPGDAEDYIHRIGRTARADSTGVALTLVNEDDMFKVKKIQDMIEAEIMKIPLPPDLGAGPEWSTQKVRKNFSRSRKGSGSYKGKKGNNRNKRR